MAGLTRFPVHNNMPRGIHPKAVGIWKHILKKNRAKIQKKARKHPTLPPTDAAWGIAMILFRRACNKVGVPAFEHTMIRKTEKELRDELVYKIRNIDKEQEAKIKEIFTLLKGQGIITYIDNEQYHSCGKHLMQYYVMGVRTAFIAASWDELITELVRGHGFLRGRDNAYCKLGAFGDVTIEDFGAGKAQIFTSIYLLQDQLKLLLGYPKDAIIEEGTLLKNLKVLGQKWFQLGRLIKVV